MKKRKWIALVMAFSMLLGQTVYAQEYAAPAAADESVETEVAETSSEDESMAVETENSVIETELGEKGSEAERDTTDNHVPFVDVDNPVIPLDVCAASLTDKYVVYDGTPKKTSVKVLDGDTELVEGEDYTVTYENNTDVGTASVIVKGNGTTYSGEITLEFQIVQVSDEVTVGENFVYIDTDNELNKIKFTPKEDGYYRFYLDTSCINIANMYTSMRQHIYSDWRGYPLVVEAAEKITAGEKFEITTTDESVKEIIKVVCEKVETAGKVNGVSWSYSEDKVLTINGTDLTQAKDDNRYPWMVFKDEAEKIVIGDQVTVIPESGFEDYSTVQSVELPEGLTSIQESAFRGNRELASVNLPETLQSIGWYAFWGCDMNHVTIPSSVKTIGEYAFGYGYYGHEITNFYIIGAKGSKAEEYATANEFLFIDADNVEIPLDLCDVSLEETCIAYDGTPKTPVVIVKDGKLELEEGKDYTVSYQNNQEVGNASVTITGKGDYSGEKTLEFQIVNVSDKLSLGDNYIEINTENGKYQVDFNAEEDAYYRIRFYTPSDDNLNVDCADVTCQDYFYGYQSSDYMIFTSTEKAHAHEVYSFKISSKFKGEKVKKIIRVTVETIEKTGELNGVSWNCSDDGILTVNGEDLELAKEGNVYPWKCFQEDVIKIVVGDQVKTLPNFIFSKFHQVTEVELPTGLQYIGYGAFEYCEKLKTINLPEGITKISDSLFGGCAELCEIEIPSSVTEIGNSAFNGCAELCEIEIPSSVTVIGKMAFYGCTDLNNITFPNTITKIGERAFANCRNLDQITIPEQIISIEDEVFEDCRNLKVVHLSENLQNIGEGAFQNCSQLQSIEIPKNVENIENSAFKGCKQLKNIQYSEGLKLIGKEAFAGCKEIESVEIPASVEVIEDGAFRGCKKINLQVNEKNQEYISEEGVLYNKDKTELIFVWYIDTKNFVVPKSVQIIHDYAFYQIDNLASFTCEETSNLKSIGEEAFFNCYRLKKIVLPESLTEIKAEAFDSCNALERIRIPSKVTKIEAYVFSDCFHLQYVELPEGIEDIGDGAFWLRASYLGDDTTLKVYYLGTQKERTQITVSKSMDRNAELDNAEWHYELLMPEGSEKCGDDLTWTLDKRGLLKITGTGTMQNYTYKAEVPWYSHIKDVKSVVIEDGATSISDYAFYGMTNLKEIQIPEGVKTIGAYAFKNDVALAQINLPSTLTKLGESAFYGCTDLSEITIPEGMYTIWSYTFKNCTNLSEVTLPSTLIKLDEAAFYGCKALTSLNVPDNVAIIGTYCFKNCSNLEEIRLPKKLAQVRESAFYATGLKNIVLPSDTASVGKYAFKNCTALKDVQIPESVNLIDESAFYGCTGLTAITIPINVSTIGNYAFSRCSGLKEIDFTGDAPTIDSYAFSKVTADVKYPADNATWTADKRQNYGGKLTWTTE